MIFSCLRCGKKEDDDRDRLKKKLKEKKTEVGEKGSFYTVTHLSQHVINRNGLYAQFV